MTLSLFPLESATIYINTERNVLYIEVSPYDQFSARNVSYYYRGYGIHSGLGANSGRSVNHYYAVPNTSGLRSETFMNNSGVGALGPGTY